jgi:hypothetical protein
MGCVKETYFGKSIVFSSSAYGDKYEGGVNSILTVNNLLLNY